MRRVASCVLLFFGLAFVLFAEPILFLHHSCGANLISQGNVRFWIDSLNTVHGTSHEFWDHGYNGDGLRNASGEWLWYDWDVPEDNTYACGFARIFHQDVDTTACTNFFSHVIDSSVLFAFKSCFPACEIYEDDTAADLADSCQQSLFNYQRLYRHIRDIIDTWPNKLFVPLTPPPLNPADTYLEQAARARHFAVWLTDTFPYEGGSHPNIAVFDWYSMLAENNPSSPEYGMLRASYRDGSDSHPNALANATTGPIFAEFLCAQMDAFLGVADKDATRPENLDISVYPNPFNSAVTISLPCHSRESGNPGDMVVEIFDINGRMVYAPSPSVPLPMGEGGNSFFPWEKVAEGRMRAFIWQPDESITSGMYLVRARIADKSIVRRALYVK